MRRIYVSNCDRYLRSPNTPQEILAIQKSLIATQQMFQRPEFNACEKDPLRSKDESKGLWIKFKIPHTIT